jgi:PAS domain S-box-containing protein
LNPIGIGESIPAAQEPPVAHDDANMALPQKIAAALTQLALSPGEEGLAGFLQSCAAYFLTLPGIQGALLAALDDEGAPYAVGHHHLLTGPDEPLVQTFSLIQEVIHKRSPGCWLDIPPTFCETEEGQRILTCFLDTASGCSGFLAVKIGENDPSGIGTVDALSENVPLMALALQSATRGRDRLQADQHQRLLDLLGAMKIAYFRADAAGITQISTATDSEITGYSPEELRVIPRRLLYPDPATQDKLLRRARENHGHLPRVLVQMSRKNGELFWGEGDLRILQDPVGQEAGFEGLYRDVTDHIRLQGFINDEADRRDLTDSELFTRLKKDAELQLDYLSSFSHQLQTPLGSLIETLRNFERGEISQKLLQQRLPYVIGQAVVCTRLVRNLSYMDKILRGEPFKKERLSFVKLAIETKRDFFHLLDEKHLEIRINDESIERHIQVQGHREMLRQVLVNLVDNAIKYSLPNTTIIIRGRKWPEGNALEIGSQGLSLSAEERERIFERGFRTQTARAIVPHGTGLGLWLARKIVEAHGATIRCLEVLEDGKKRILFRIIFPNPIATRRSS